MKTPIVALLLFFGARLAATEPSLIFNSKIEFPPLSLIASASQAPATIPPVSRDWFQSQPTLLLSPKVGSVLTSAMPVVVRGGDLDPKMVKTPDASVDFKLTVKTPDFESAK